MNKAGFSSPHGWGAKLADRDKHGKDLNAVCILQALTHQLVVELRSEPRPVLVQSLPLQIQIPYSEGTVLMLALLPSSFIHSFIHSRIIYWASSLCGSLTGPSFTEVSGREIICKL